MYDHAEHIVIGRIGSARIAAQRRSWNRSR